MHPREGRHTHVRLARRDVPHDFGTRSLHHLHLHVFEVREKPPEPPRKEGDARVVVAADGDPLFLPVRKGREPRLQGFRLKEDFLRGLREDLSRGIEAKAPGTSSEKLRPRPGFEVGETVTRRARRQMDVFGRLRDAPGERDGGKDAQVLQIKVQHGSFFRKFRKCVAKLSDGFECRREGRINAIGRNPTKKASRFPTGFR